MNNKDEFNTTRDKNMKKPRQYSLVKFTKIGLRSTLFDHNDFKREDKFLFLGEIPNLKGHCAVATPNGLIIRGFHMEDFSEVPNSELEHVIATISIARKKRKK